MNDINTEVLALNLVILICNISVLGLTLKLYTEYFKDRSQGKRDGKP